MSAQIASAARQFGRSNTLIMLDRPYPPAGRAICAIEQVGCNRFVTRVPHRVSPEAGGRDPNGVRDKSADAIGQASEGQA